MLSATADTKVYISGLNFGGEPRRFLSLAEAGVFELAVSDEILAEIAKVLAFKKGWPPQRIQELIAFLVTGDNHLLRLCQYRGTRLVRLAEFMESLQEGLGHRKYRNELVSVSIRCGA